MDPKQRLLLETSYCALENGKVSPNSKPSDANLLTKTAGIPAESVAASGTSVFIATSSHDYEAMLHRDPEQQPKYMGTGIGQALIANRVSWFFNFRGPSVTLDTACSGSLVALHLACQSLRSKESSMVCVRKKTLHFQVLIK